MLASAIRKRFFVTASLRSSYGLWIDGREVPAQAGATFNVLNPATGAPVTKVAEGRGEDVSAAFSVAKRSFDSGVWRNTDPIDRSRVLWQAAKLLQARVPQIAEQESQQTGRAVREMYSQLGRLPEWLEYFGSLIRVAEGTVPPFKGPYLNYVKRVPLGVVGQITPWNHPMLIAIKKIAPALAAGNSIVVKPSELAPCTLIEFAHLLKEAGLPDGVFNVVPGFGATAGRALSEHPGLGKLDLTGGTETGKIAAAAAGKNLTSVIMELGGKAPVLVFEDADIPQAVNGAAFAAFIAAGQTCIMGSRIIIHEAVYDKFMSALVEKVRGIRLGDPMSTDTQMGPLISAAQRDKVERFVELAKQEGARVLTGGCRPDLGVPWASGFWYEPTLIGDALPHMRVVREEVFGPVVVAYTFKDEADAVRLANDSPFGLAAAVWTKDVKRAHRVADAVRAGIVWVNDHHRNSPSSPWGGFGDSGIGRENGLDAYHEYTASKSVVVNTSDEPFDWFVTNKNVRYS